MKVTTNTPDLLIVENRPWAIGLALIAFTLIFVAVGITMITGGEVIGGIFTMVFGGGTGVIAFLAFVRRSQTVFHRPEGWVEIRRRHAFGRRTVRHDLSEIAAAKLEHMSDTARVVLVIEDGQSAGIHPLTQAYTSGSHHARIEQAINDWLSGRSA